MSRNGLHRCRTCGHRPHPNAHLHANPSPKDRAWTLAELMEPPRLNNLITKRPDVADRALLGARIAAGVLENA